METSKKIIVETIIQVPVDKVWKYWTESTHVTNWNSVSEDWRTPHAGNELKIYLYR